MGNKRRKIYHLLAFTIILAGAALSASYAHAEIKDFRLQVAIPGYTPNFDGSTRPIGEYIRAVMGYITGAAGIIATVVMMFGGVLWLTAGGNSGQISEAKAWITGALTGLVLAMGSYLILSTINTDLVNFNTAKIKTADQLGCCQESNACSIQPKTKCKGNWLANGTCYKDSCSSADSIDAKKEAEKAQQIAEIKTTNAAFYDQCTQKYGTVQAIEDTCYGELEANVYDTKIVGDDKRQYACCVEKCKNPSNAGASCTIDGENGYCNPSSKMCDTAQGNPGEWCGAGAAGKCYFNLCPSGQSWLSGGRDCDGTLYRCCK